MARQSGRSYQSPMRQRQADETRHRILEAARQLLEAHGYAGMTIEAIAREAGVAHQTVYAIFRSKTGILTGLMDQARFGPDYEELVRQALANTDPATRLRFAARIARSIYDSESTMLDLLRGAGAVSSELANREREKENMRYDAQAPMIDFLVETDRLKERVDQDAARDILWTLTGRDIYRMLVQERGWTSDRYEAWVAETLVATLLS